MGGGTRSRGCQRQLEGTPLSRCRLPDVHDGLWWLPGWWDIWLGDSGGSERGQRPEVVPKLPWEGWSWKPSIKLYLFHWSKSIYSVTIWLPLYFCQHCNYRNDKTDSKFYLIFFLHSSALGKWNSVNERIVIMGNIEVRHKSKRKSIFDQSRGK